MAGALLLICSAAPAVADVKHSANWSGYAVHRAGVRFDRVSAQWTEPAALCIAGHRTFSAFWVGLGGFRLGASALEQVGTEVDCLASGTARSTAWYELVPAGSKAIHLSVRPGDTVAASVTAAGGRVTLALANHTSGQSFHTSVRDRRRDLSSAEWIAEAPSECSGSACQTLPLANFGTTTFAAAQARSTRGWAGSISSRRWSRTRIILRPSGRHFVVADGAGMADAAATPSPLATGGSQFTVSYSTVALASRIALASRRVSLRAGYLVH